MAILTITSSNEIVKIHLTVKFASLNKILTTTNVPMLIKKISIHACSEKPNGTIVNNGKTIQ